MIIILLWIAASAAIGWFGRKRVVGFWGFFVLSIFLSPILTGLFLLVGAPGKRYVQETEARVANSLRRAGFAPKTEVSVVAQAAAPLAAHSRTPALRGLVLAWLIVIAAFAGLYTVMGSTDTGGLTGSSFGVMQAVQLSFDAGTLGAGDAADAVGGALPWLASLERLLVLLVLVLMIAALINGQLASLRQKNQAIAPTDA